MTWRPPPFQPPMPATFEDFEHQQHLQHQPDHPASPQNADFLLQFLKSGCGSNENHVQPEGPPGGNYWHHDPAVAALGPSHSFQMVPPPPLPLPSEHNQQLTGGPIFMPQHMRFSWSPQFHHQPEHAYPPPPPPPPPPPLPGNDNPFDHGYIRPFGLPVERPYHPGPAPGPYRFPPPPAFPPEAHRAFHHVPGPPPGAPGPIGGPQHQPATRFGSLDIGPDGNRLPTDIGWPGLQEPLPGGGPRAADREPVHHFYGNGAELLHLLQGGGTTTHAKVVDGTTIGKLPEPQHENGEQLVGDPMLPQRGSPSTVHGPIGPPRRQVSPPQSPNDLLGRFWAALPSQHPLFGQDDMLVSQLEEAEERKLEEEKVRGESSPVLLLRREPVVTSDEQLGPEPNEQSPPEKNYHHVSGSNAGRGRPVVNGEDADAGSDDYRGNNGANGNRRRSNGRPDQRRMVKGQWVAVNERQHRDVAENRDSQNEAFKAAAAAPSPGPSQNPNANGYNAKMRDELRRRRKLQQEWRVKSAQPTSSSDSSRSEPSFRRGPSLASQIENPGLPSGSTQDSAVGFALEESKQRLHSSEANGDAEEAITEHVAELQLEPRNNFIQKPRSQRLRESKRYIPMHRKERWFRPDLQEFTTELIAIYKELIPSEEENSRRKKFLSKLDSLVEREWPGARLFLFGSCANAFGVCNSDIDVCLTVDEEEPNKAELVVKMASILESDEMIKVQALTHARVPIVKFTDPETSISCDICVNNMLAVVNSKLLHDYSQIDIRLRQLAFMVKHWAKRRQVNETYRGTLSSYAYVLMCIHFLQQRRPPILPCLQEMPATYEVKVRHIRCSYYDKVENLKDFGGNNKETLGELLTGFFEYWAHEHDYNSSVISVRTGGYLSKDEKNWTRRIGNERHLICIEDPFEVSHDLGRVVDKHSIKALRGEFYRAAGVMKSDPNPCVRLFEPYIREYNDQE